MKDWLLSHFGHWLINRHLKPYGNMTSFQIDTENKKIFLSADLRGEASCIEITASYATSEIGGQTHLSVTRVESSREWLTDLANSYLAANPFAAPVPPGVLSAAVRILKI
jgi:hypothetical protein